MVLYEIFREDCSNWLWADEIRKLILKGMIRLLNVEQSSFNA